MESEDLRRLKEVLEKRRDEIYRFRSILDDSWKGLQESEVEYEETASKRALSLGIEELDEREAREIEAVDAALRRLETGDYGICLSCGETISLNRLEAIPWTPVCARCAAKAEKESGRTPA